MAYPAATFVAAAVLALASSLAVCSAMRHLCRAVLRCARQAVLHYKGRLGAKQGWIFDSTFEHKDEYGGPEPFEFVVGSPKVPFCSVL